MTTPVPSNVHSLETQRAIASLSGPISKFVGMAAALEAAKAFLQVEMGSRDSSERFDPVFTARSVVAHRVENHEAYGASWRGADVTEISTILAFTWVEACTKEKDEVSPDEVAALEAAAGDHTPDADF